jgi:hypothetical protein
VTDSRNEELALNDTSALIKNNRRLFALMCAERIRREREKKRGNQPDHVAAEAQKKLTAAERKRRECASKSQNARINRKI